MFAWLYDFIGVHICESFSAWEDKSMVCTRAATPHEAGRGFRKVRYVRRWQERRCLDCGKVVQRKLKYGGV